MTSSNGHRSPSRRSASDERTPALARSTTTPIAIRTSGNSRPRFLYKGALAAASQKQEPGGNEDDGTHDLPMDEAEPSEIGDQEVCADRDQDDPEPQPPGSVTMGRSRPATLRGRGHWRISGRGRAGRIPGRRWRSAAGVRAEAGAKVFPELVTHRTQASTDVPRGRCRRALRGLHQEPERPVEDDADADPGWNQGKNHEDDADQQGVDTEVGGEARTVAPDDPIRSTPQDAPRRLTHGPAIIPRGARTKKRARAARPLRGPRP